MRISTYFCFRRKKGDKSNGLLTLYIVFINYKATRYTTRPYYSITADCYLDLYHNQPFKN